MIAPSAGSAPGAPARRPLSRLAVTLAAPILVGLAVRIPLPGVDRHAFDGWGVLALGLEPVVSGFVLVELAALVVPAWRPLRVGGHAGRATLATAAIGLGLVLAVIQARGLVAALRSTGALSDGTLPGALVALTLVAGSAALTWVASLAGRHGLTNGYATLLAAGALTSSWGGIRSELTPLGGMARLGASGPLAVVLHLGCMVLVVAAVAAMLLVNDETGAGGVERPWLRNPASGLVPLSLATSLLLVPATLAGWIPALRGLAVGIPGALYQGLRFALAVPLALLLARLFNRPSKVAEVWGRVPGALPDAAEREARASAALRVARIRAATLVGLLVLASALVEGMGPESLAFAAAAVADAFAEWRARNAWPGLVSVWPEPRLYAVDAALAALTGAGIPAFARGVHYRTLGQFFAPYVPAEILVPAGRAAEAEVILRRGLVGEGSPVDRPSASA